MTNLSKALLSVGSPESIREARFWISKAASCADRRFRWWRNVREQIEEVSPSASGLSVTPIKPRYRGGGLEYLWDLHAYYKSLKLSEDPARRGYELQELVERLLKLCPRNAVGSYVIRSDTETPAIQIDGFSFLDKDYYRIETKWTSQLTQKDEIILFRARLDNVESKGLFISISGFAESAVKQAKLFRTERQILLMDGDELELVLQGYPTFDEAIRIKQLHFALSSDVYFWITAARQVASDYH
jgi:hypothetical protein